MNWKFLDRKYNWVHFLFILISILNCSAKKSSEIIKFSNAFPHATVYESKEGRLVETGKISNGTKLATTNQTKYFEYKTYHEVIYQNKKVWVEESQLQDGIKKFYFAVDTPKGLNLREEPSIKSKTIDLLPFDTIGEVLEWNDQEELIQNKKGFWIRINYNQKTGWIFSGFLTIDHDLGNLKDRSSDPYSEIDFYRNFRNTKYFKEAQESEFSKEEISKLQIMEQMDFHSYRILKLKYIQDGNEIPKILFYNTINNRYYSFNTKEWMDKGEIFPLKTSLDRVLLYNHTHGFHGQFNTFFLFFLKNKIVQVPFHPDTDGYCYSNDVVGGFSPFIRNRYNAESKMIYTFAKHGKCPDDEDQKEIEKDREENPNRGYHATPKKFTASQFVILKWGENSVTLEKYYEHKIPDRFLKDWNDASLEKNYIQDPSKFID